MELRESVISRSEVYIGPAGWSYPDWEGVVYPRPKPRSFDPLVYLSSYFNLIEINSTFYRIPTVSTCRSWAGRVADQEGFAFSVKAFREFTHKRGPLHDHDVRAFTTAIAPLWDAGVLNTVLIQFPWSFKFSPDARDYVHTLTRGLSPIPVTVEVRHASWSADAALNFFRDHGVTLCGIDQPIIGASLQPDVFSPGSAGCYFRLHGRNRANWFDANANRDARYDYLYSAAELSAIRERIDRAAATPQKTHVVLNNHFRGQAVANALQLKAMVEGRKMPAPPQLLASYPRLVEVLRPEQHGPAPSRTDSTQVGLFEGQDEEQQNDRPADDYL
jgi:uncharacterized protein YecE (DUF72 family)